ncbi:hypothetical protein O0I10_006682 [Lichtheimia ornata]|uniref:Uncharacterized protein n=1 Tax=Lichtheimia ornata TaxID=688661 RepID=A0AAD7V1I2_9FUNG|nr:uncharacterized protein O0I10_006682 [Lichtheimia ornata]KAJ8657618.1 hypothetical protein O0I10_006682 [Lichtheimia ornata]
MLLCVFLCAFFLTFPWLLPIALFLYLAVLLVLELALPLAVLSCLAVFYYYVWCSVAAYLEKWLAIADFSCVSQVVDANPTLITNLPVCPRLGGVAVSSRVAGAVSSRGAVSAVAVSCGVTGLGGEDVGAVAEVAEKVVEEDVPAAVDDGVVPGVEEVVLAAGEGVPVGVDRDSDSARGVVEVAFVPAGAVVVPEVGGTVPSDGVPPVPAVVGEPVPAAPIAPVEDVPFVGDDGDHDDVDDELAFLMYHLSVEDRFDEDAYMAPPFDRRYEEPVELMEIDADIISIMFANLTFPPFPAFLNDDDDDDPIDVDMPFLETPSQAATPQPSPPPSPTPIPMEVEPTIVTPVTNPTTTSAMTTINTTNITIRNPLTPITTTAPMTTTTPSMPTTISMPTTSMAPPATGTTPTTSTRFVTPVTASSPHHRHPTTCTVTTNSATPHVTLATLAFRPRPFTTTNQPRVTPTPISSDTSTINTRKTTRPPSPRPQPRGALQQAMPQPTMRAEDAAALAELLRELGAVAEEEDDDDDDNEEWEDIWVP